MANRTALHAVIDEVLSVVPTETVIGRLERAEIAYSRMNSVAEFIDHPQLTQRDRWTSIGSQVGEIRALKPPVVMEGVEPVMRGVPSLGEHTHAVLEELGFDRATIDAWKRAGVI